MPITDIKYAPFRLVRSELYVPGNNQKVIGKGAASDADALILNAEDGIAFDKKAEAREGIVTALNTIDFGDKTISVRINALDAMDADGEPLWKKDIKAILAGDKNERLDMILLPKVLNARDVREFISFIEIEERVLGRKKPLGISLLIEHPRAVMNIGEIASAHPRVEQLDYGAGDFMGSMGISSPTVGLPEYIFALQAIAVDAKANGLRAINTPLGDVKKPELLEELAANARGIGFTGMQAIHPDQIETINGIMSPSVSEMKAAAAVVEADRNANGGAVLLDGSNMVDAANVRTAYNTLKMAEIVEGRAAAKWENKVGKAAYRGGVVQR